MAIASPTLFICVVSVGSACGMVVVRKHLEGKARNLGDDVINARLEARRSFARDVVLEFVEQAVAVRQHPTASLAAIFAMGKPVALDASAELRLTRGFISMMTMRPLSGLTPNWMFEPPVSTPTARMTAKLWSRMI